MNVSRRIRWAQNQSKHLATMKDISVLWREILTRRIWKFRIEEGRVLKEMGLEERQLKDFEYLAVRRSLLEIVRREMRDCPDTAAEMAEYLRRDPKQLG